MPHRRSESTTARLLTCAVFLLVFAAATGATASLQRDRSEWQIIKVEDLLTFQLPKGWTRSSKNVSDLRDEWRKGGRKLIYRRGHTDSGDYTDRRRSWMNDYQEMTTRIGGQKANVRSFSFIKGAEHRFVAELNIGNWDNNQVQFFMHVEGRDSATVELAREIFKSVKLALPSPERSSPLQLSLQSDAVSVSFGSDVTFEQK